MKNKLIKLFQDNMKIDNSVKIVNQDNEATIYIYDAIGGWYGIDAQAFVKEINAIDAEVIHLRVNSPGGDVFDARAMQTALSQHKAKVVVHIDGLAASAATFLIQGADEIEMSEGAFFMIHNAWTLALGNSEDLRGTADLLDKVDDAIINDYHKKTNQEKDKIKDWMSKETWFSAEAGNTFNLSAYANTPENLLKNEAPEYDRATILRRLNLIERGI